MAKVSALNLSQRVQSIKPSPTLSVGAKADELIAAGKDILNLSVGEPDFDTPAHIKEAAIKSIHEGHTKYTAVDGIKPLKQAIIDKFKRDNKLSYELNQILVSCGAKHSLFNLFASILNAGDEVIIPAPYWVSYPDIVKLTDGVPVIVATEFKDSFKMNAEQLKTAITDKTRAIILNSPSNPSGIAYSIGELKALGEVLLKHPNILVVTDDIYEHNMWNHLPFANIVNATPELYERSVVINGVSKTYAMTGWRIGYAGGPANIIAAMKKAQSQSTSSPATASQYAALAALSSDQSCVKAMTSAYKERHDYLVAELNKIPGWKCLPSDGTFYTFPSIAGALHGDVKDDLAFSQFLLEKAGIAVVPGSAFGVSGHIRISYATSMDNLKNAVARIRNLSSILIKTNSD